MGIKIKDGFIDFCVTKFKCPHCDLDYNDDKDKYVNRCNKNKSGITKIKCKCGETFGMTYSQKNEAISFKLKKKFNDIDLENAIEKAKPNLDKIKNVDKHLKNIRQ